MKEKVLVELSLRELSVLGIAIQDSINFNANELYNIRTLYPEESLFNNRERAINLCYFLSDCYNMDLKLDKLYDLFYEDVEDDCEGSES